MSRVSVSVLARLLAIALGACALPLVLAPSAASAFVVDFPGARPTDPRDDVRMAPRWDSNALDFKFSGERGWGGGLEYAVDPSVCVRLRFVDAPDCAEIQAEIARAAARWTAGREEMQFTDVTGLIQPSLPRTTQPWLGDGAELDIFAVAEEEYRPFAIAGPGTLAFTSWYFTGDKTPRRLDGAVLTDALGTITAADMRLNANACYYLNILNATPDCRHFGSLILHEFGHVLGIGHADEFADRNLDSNADPYDAVPIDCLQPTMFLTRASDLDTGAVSISRWLTHENWLRGPSFDDLAARDALYPRCAGSDTLMAASLVIETLH
jgi:hypothetical protein